MITYMVLSFPLLTVSWSIIAGLLYLFHLLWRNIAWSNQLPKTMWVSSLPYPSLEYRFGLLPNVQICNRKYANYI